MSDVWGALGRGIEHGISAALQRKEQQLERQRDEEAKARAEQAYILAKASHDEDAAYRALQQVNVLEERRLTREAEERGYTHAEELQKLKGVQELQQIQESGKWATAREKAGKEPPPKLYDPNFNPTAAAALAMLNTGLSGVQLQGYLSGQEGQKHAANLVASLTAIHGLGHPDLENQLWNLFDRIASGNLQTPTEQAAAGLAQQQALAQRQAAQATERAAREKAAAEYRARQVPLPQTAGQMQQALQQPSPIFGQAVANPELVTGVQMPQTLEEMVMGRKSGPTQQEQFIIDQYTNPNTPDVVRQSIVGNPAYREILRKYGKL
jgi:hypothetical protein